MPSSAWQGLFWCVAVKPLILMRPKACWCISQSILAYIKEAMGGRQPRKLSVDVLAAPELTSPPRDRDRRTRMPRKPQTRHDRTKRSSDRPKSPRARFSGSGSTVTSSSPSRDLEGPEQERPGRPRRRRTQGSTREMVSSLYTTCLCALNCCSTHAVVCR